MLFIHGSNNSDSVVFRNECFGEIKDHSSTTTYFQKISAMEVLDMSFPYVKRYFQKHQ